MWAYRPASGRKLTGLPGLLKGVSFTGNGANGWGAIAGGQIGCNYQINQLVVGIEGDGVWSGIQNTGGLYLIRRRRLSITDQKSVGRRRRFPRGRGF